MRTAHAITVVALLGVTACTGDGSSSSRTTVTPTSASASSAPTTGPAGSSTVPVSTAPASTVSPTSVAPSTPSTAPASTAPPTVAPPSTTEPCAFAGGTADRADGFPNRMSSMVGVDIRTGGHRCYERIVIELADVPGAPGAGQQPGWWVRYADGPVYLGESNETVDLRGDATLLITIASWMPTLEGEGYAGPRIIYPRNVSRILELHQVENWEGYSVWAVGLDRERPFHVFTLTKPARLVVDVAI